ncbi:hypothetical protein K438DRAFT_2026302 [Mycena galopus ATCC 62051]|nr:hypothetical protein K438DRAFT_2026302 [Mycena galopus ATCC 62051]
MSSADVPLVSHQERPIDVTGVLSAQDADWPDVFVDTTATLLRMSQKPPKRPLYKSSRVLRPLSLVLHCGLVGTHLILLAIWWTGLENRLIFPAEEQTLLSFLITAIVTGFGTVYCAVLVMLTQILSVRRSLQKDQALTATHDNAIAWTGIGSASLLLWDRMAVPASMLGVMYPTLYLGGILVLHITIPALFSMESFTSSRSISVPTRGLPSFNLSGLDFSNETNRDFSWQTILGSGAGPLYFLPSVLGSTTTVGVRDGTFYDVPKPSAGQGNVTVNAIGFNLTCGYLKNVETKWTPDTGRWTIIVDGLDAGSVSPTRKFHFQGTNSSSVDFLEPGLISTVIRNVNLYPWNYTLWYSTIPIVDSQKIIGPRVSLKPPMNTSVSEIQLLSCSQSLVGQTAVLDAQSLRLRAVNSSIAKSVSSWTPATLTREDLLKNPVEMLGEPDPLLMLHTWQAFYPTMPASPIPLVFGLTMKPSALSVGDLYLNQKLDLLASTLKSEIFLHDLENTLSTIVAAMFWAVGNIAPPPGYEGFIFHMSDNPAYHFQIREPSNSPIMLEGNATVNEIFTQVRVDLSILAVTAGLAISMALTLLSLPFFILCKHAEPEIDIPIDGVGILHAIWLYRNHPQLETLLEQVDHPNDDNLCSAGMIRTKLVEGGLRRRKSSELIQP